MAARQPAFGLEDLGTVGVGAAVWVAGRPRWNLLDVGACNSRGYWEVTKKETPMAICITRSPLPSPGEVLIGADKDGRR
jgi:hypothetical protein